MDDLFGEALGGWDEGWLPTSFDYGDFSDFSLGGEWDEISLPGVGTDIFNFDTVASGGDFLSSLSGVGGLAKDVLGGAVKSTVGNLAKGFLSPSKGSPSTGSPSASGSGGSSGAANAKMYEALQKGMKPDLAASLTSLGTATAGVSRPDRPGRASEAGLQAAKIKGRSELNNTAMWLNRVATAESFKTGGASMTMSKRYNIG